MSTHKNLHFFNKQGDSLNFKYDENLEIFQGDILFDENSTDTFKTYALYTLEQVPSFTFYSPGELGTNKFQLFNEYGIHFYGATTSSFRIDKLEPANNDPSFYSKWIYGHNFESIFPVGTLIRFNKSMLEFTNPDQTYVVTGTKKGAILIISGVDNATFESIYSQQYLDTNFYLGKTISGINAIGVYNYINDEYVNQLSIWNEPNFYDNLYKGKKLNVIHSGKNDGIYTVKGPEITDVLHYEYILNEASLPVDSNLIIEVLLGTDLPKLYDGGVNINDSGKIYLTDYINFPRTLRSGQEFKIVGSSFNQNFFTVADIYNFQSNTSTKFYNLDEQVLYNGILYQCIQSYTHSYADTLTRFITPINNPDYWSHPTYIGVNEVTTDESLLFAQIYLTKDRYYYEYGFTQSSEVTLASVAEKYATDLDVFDIDLYYQNGYLKADSKYPSKYVTVNFYHTDIDTNYLIGSSTKTFERLIEVDEQILREFNYDYSENYKFSIVFTDLDEYGLKIIINKMIYDEQIAWVYNGVNVDMLRTIDRTLRNWLTRNYLILYRLGIDVELDYTYVTGGPATSLFVNSIIVKTEYPNVPIIINDVLVGTTANYFIDHSRVIFDDLGPSLNININGNDHFVQSITSSLSTSTYSMFDIPATIQAWSDLYATNLLEHGYIFENINNVLKISLNQVDNNFSYKIATGRLNLPGLSDFRIIDKIKGNFGCLVASNEVILSTTSSFSFENEGFATGMVFALNNTEWPLMNVEYNIEFLDPNVLNLSYQGPFWDVNNFICDKSPFVTIAFNLGFGQTGCGPIGTTGTSGQFDAYGFSASQFNINFYPNSYELYDYDIIANAVDIKYLQYSNSIYVLGDDLAVYDSYTMNFITNIELSGNINPIKIEFNPINCYLYCLSENKVWVVDPAINLLISSFNLLDNAFDLQICPINGDVYISYINAFYVDIYLYNSFTSYNFRISNIYGNTGRFAYNDFENSMYVTTDADYVIKINCSTRQEDNAYNVLGLLPTIAYESSQESIYVYGSSNLYRINDGILSATTFTSQLFNDVIYNPLTSEMNISDSSNNFTRYSIDDQILNQTGISHYGFIALSPYDGGIYISAQNSNSIVTVDSYSGELVYLHSLMAPTTKIIYNPDKKTILAIQPSTNKVVEIRVIINNRLIESQVSSNLINDGLYGTLDPNFVNFDDIWLKTRDYFRRPRENFNGDSKITYYFKWFSDNVPQFFLYDFSGTQLSRTTTGSYSYIGQMPLPTVVLNNKPNNDVSKISMSEFQQTIFDTIEYELSYIDDLYDISTKVEPLQLFVGFNSSDEGALRSILQLYKKEEIEFTLISGTMCHVTLSTLDPEGDKRGLIEISNTSDDYFSDKGLKAGQHIAIFIKDNTSQKNQYLSNNNGTLLKIREVHPKSLVVDFFNTQTDILEYEKTMVNHPKETDILYLDFSIKVVDKEIGRFFTYGQTEEEDIRFKIELGNVGKLIAPEDVFIFKEYDIEEGGIDWIYLNRKRKEMLMMKHLIYPYIGSYKSIINAINFFGFNDLQLNEYYRNIDPDSINFLKLFKVEIPDIFDNSVEGWTENDFIKHLLPSDNFETTNLFNLNYFITDKFGNNILNYTLDEVIIKLQGLKYWLKKNIIPLTHKIQDITGNVYFSGINQIQHKVLDVSVFNIHENMTPISFKLDEAYLMPVNSGSTVYNCVLDFYSIIPNIGADKTKNGLIEPPKPYNGFNLSLPDYFTIKIRTYKTYKEWAPFKVYSIGDRVTYYGKLYESTKDINKVNSPRRYEDVPLWVSNTLYESATIIGYNREYYSALTTNRSTIPPINDTTNWSNISFWKEIDWNPVQTITEFRQGSNLLPFNFTIDSNIDPFITVEVTSDNGYGSVYCDRKNYEIRGLKDLQEPYQDIESIGPFQPIVYLTT